nr:hypothetical protein [Biomaibacter acetigenes]
MRVMTYAEALREAMRNELKRDPRVFIMGEDVGRFGGCFGVTGNLVEEFGEDRVRDTPISEEAIAGAAIGAAANRDEASSGDNVHRLCYCGHGPACNQAAKMRYMFGGNISLRWS